MAKTVTILKAAALAISISLLGSAQCLNAESLSYCGIKVSPDSLKTIDSRNVKIKIGLEESIIARDNLGEWILSRVIKDPLRFSAVSDRELVEFIRNCSDSGRPEIVSAFIAELFERAQLPASYSVRDILSFSGQNEKFLKTIIEDLSWEDRIRTNKNLGQIELISDALAELMLRDPVWVKSRVLRLYYLLSRQIYEKLFKKTREALLTEDLETLSNLESAIDLIEKDYSSEIAGLRSVARSARELLSGSADLKDLGATIEQTPLRTGASDKSIQASELLYPILSAKVLAQSRRFMSEEKLEQALKSLSLLPVSRSSPEALGLFMEISKQLSVRPDIELDSNALDLFEYFSRSGEIYFDSYIELLESKFFSAIDSNRLAESEYLLSRILSVRPDPAILNDQLRFQQILKYQQLGVEERKQAKLLELRTDLSLYQKMQLVFSNRQSLVPLVLLIVAVVAAFFCALRFQLINKFKQEIIKLLEFKNRSHDSGDFSRAGSDSEESEQDESEQNPETSRFVTRDRPSSSDPVLNEYEECLSKLRLGVSASLKDIKSAYRSVVKECHPDVNPNQSQEQTMKFAEISKVYDKLLELRKELGMAD